MKVNTLQILLLLLVYSCNSRQEERIENKDVGSSIDQMEVLVASTAYDFPNLELPYNFYLDSITIYDTVSRANYKAFYLQSNLPEKERFNQTSLQFVKDQIMLKQSHLETYEGNSPAEIIYSYQLRPTEIYSDSQIISISNIIDTYSEGGNHHNYERYTFNYDFNANELIGFNDVFNLQSKNDSMEFVAFAEQHTLDGCTEWDWPNKYIDFSFAENGIYINPNLSWACIATRSLLPVDTENKFIKKEWTKQTTTNKK